MIYIGIDPGLRTGAWGAIDHNGTFLRCGDIPAGEQHIDARALAEQLRQAIPADEVAEICIELVGVMPGQGIASSGKFMRAAGAIDAICALMRHPVAYTRPQEWKKRMGLSSNKDESLQLARRLFPEAKRELERVKDHGRAEALLIAEFWRRQMLWDVSYALEACR